MTQTGPDVQPPGQPYQAWEGGQQPATPAAAPPAKKTKRWLSLAGAVVVAGGVAAVKLTGGFGLGDPEVGDCVQMQCETDFAVVDCGSADAEYRIVGVDEKKQSYETFQADPEVCAAFATTEVALWIGDPVGAEGTTYCAQPTA